MLFSKSANFGKNSDDEIYFGHCFVIKQDNSDNK